MPLLSWLEFYENSAGSLNEDGTTDAVELRCRGGGRGSLGKVGSRQVGKVGKVVDGIGTAPENWTNAAKWLRFAGFRSGRMCARMPAAHRGKSRLGFGTHPKRERDKIRA
ncbi:hypothetical protein OOU_Y34scaffold00514g71 [Pyricularia oryzae Y34]|uniref:Uncharacterized protein n=2 Tax=Pyricularia oryzae TaxID=318829 RepID=A0AA97PLQ5_PYRO3|nr:hypothetical protein OOU_Y34scaffold00514g71 [Pyricularia oryzae Y34]